MSGFKFSFDIMSSSNKKEEEEEEQEEDVTCDQKSPITTTSTAVTATTQLPAPRAALPDDTTITLTKSETKQRPSIQMLNIPLIMSNMTSLPHEWKRDQLILSGKKSSASASATATATSTAITTASSSTNDDDDDGNGDDRPIILEKIDIHQHPFRKNCSREPTSNETTDTIMDQDSDLIPGYYEGGLKLWECSIDLCNYISFLIRTNHQDIQHVLQTHDHVHDHGNGNVNIGHCSGGRVLELGCGHGLPACLMLQELLKQRQNNPHSHPHSHPDPHPHPHLHPIIDFKVVFSDYNEFVLRDVTLPNILLNCKNPYPSESKENVNAPLQDYLLNQCCVLVAGDWMSLSQHLIQQQQQQQPQQQPQQPHNPHTTIPCNFDCILAAETTYTLQSAQETAYLLSHHLDPKCGIGFVAMKRYYFGVGGGSDAFCSACHDYGLETELVEVYQDGKSNIRDLWRVQIKHNSPSS